MKGTAQELAVEILKLMGIDPGKVTKLSIHFPMDGLVTAEVTMFMDKSGEIDWEESLTEIVVKVVKE